MSNLICGTRILRVISRAGRPCHFVNSCESNRATVSLRFVTKEFGVSLTPRFSEVEPAKRMDKQPFSTVFLRSR